MFLTIAVLCFFAIVQSVYGVGLLVFGTPYLILNNVGFDEAIGILLPSSFLISIHQVIVHRNVVTEEAKSLLPVMVGLPLGLIFALEVGHGANIMPILGIALLSAAFIRSNRQASKYLSEAFKANKSKFHFLNSLIHGASNFGGALLPLYSSSVYSEKIQALKCTSVFYSIYSGMQIIVLVILKKSEVFYDGITFMPFCLFCYWVAGSHAIKIVSQELFDRLAIVFFWCIGLVFLARSMSQLN